jgi:ketosteroid isomerase-like protein
MRVFTAVALALALPVLACQPAARPLSSADAAAVRGLGVSYAQAVLAKNADGVAALYATDAVEMPPNEPARVGKTAIRTAYANSGEASAFTVTSAQVDGRDDLAYDRGTWSWTGKLPGSTQPSTLTGKYLAIARRQLDSTWLWTAVIWNDDVQLPRAQ